MGYNYCPNCGSEIKRPTNYCLQCGVSLKKDNRSSLARYGISKTTIAIAVAIIGLIIFGFSTKSNDHDIGFNDINPNQISAQMWEKGYEFYFILQKGETEGITDREHNKFNYLGHPDYYPNLTETDEKVIKLLTDGRSYQDDCMLYGENCSAYHSVMNTLGNLFD